MNIPEEVQFTLKKLEDAGFEAFIVGGCVRDFIMGRVPNDWDITTNAKPEEIQKIFPDSLYENQYGMVTVRIGEDKESRFEIQVTTYRIESGYSDKRHPDDVQFVKTLEEDLARRDFTVNAMAISQKCIKSIKSKVYKVESPTIGDPAFAPSSAKVTVDKLAGATAGKAGEEVLLIDLFNGQEDIENKIIRAVGDAGMRFEEDALRMMRAVRFATQFDFKIEEKTAEAIKNNAQSLEKVSQERVRDELVKIILSEHPANGIEMLQKLELLKLVIPEVEYGIGVGQNRHHTYTIYQHLILSLQHCPSKKLTVRLAALFHDVAKPQTKHGEGFNSTFYNHDYVGSKVVRKILKRLRFSNEIIDKVSLLVKNHMFFYNVDEVSDAGVRRIVKRIGAENVKDLIDLRIADRLGSGVPKAKPYKLRHFEYMIDKVSKDPISTKMLKINGSDIMDLLNIKPGPKVGCIMDALLSEVLDDPSRNDKEYLEKRAKEISELNLNEIRKLAKEKIEEKKEEEEQVLKRRYYVK